MYEICSYTGVIYGVHVGKYSIHGAYGIVVVFFLFYFMPMQDRDTVDTSIDMHCCMVNLVNMIHTSEGGKFFPAWCFTKNMLLGRGSIILISRGLRGRSNFKSE